MLLGPIISLIAAARSGSGLLPSLSIMCPRYFIFSMFSCAKFSQKKMNFFWVTLICAICSRYLLKYDVNVSSSSEEYEKFSIVLEMVFCKKENSFSMGLLLVSSKTCFWNSSCLSWFSFQVCRSNFSIFSSWGSSYFCHFSSILSWTCNCWVF